MLDEERRVLDALGHAGVDIPSLRSLAEAPERNEDALAVLLELLPDLKNPQIRDWVLRALTRPSAVDAAASQIREAEDRRIAAVLASEGLQVESVYDLLRMPDEDYAHAIPMLLRLLPAAADPVVKEGVVRALTMDTARRDDVARALVEEFEAIPPESSVGMQALKWSIGNALGVVATREVFDDLIRLVRERRHGKSREMLILALARSPRSRDEAIQVARELLADGAMAGHALLALRRLRAATDEDARPLLNHPRE